MESPNSVYEKAPPYTKTSQEIPQFVSEADYWQFYYDYPDESFEWNNGKLEKRPMTDKLSYLLYEWFLCLIREYFKAFSEGESMGQELGFILNLGHKKTIRKPDLAIIHRNNPTKFEMLDRSYKGTCDMCIEFLSDSTRQEVERDTVVKKEEYAQAGVQEYFILDRLHKETAFYRLAPTSVSHTPLYQSIVPSPEGVIQSQVLSQFAFRLEHLHSLPEFESLIEDPVYQPFIVKPYQEERQAKEHERQAKEEALEKAEYERQAKEEALEKAEYERQAKEEALKKAEQERRAKESALETAKQEQLAREALEAELSQLRKQIPKDVT